MHSSVAAQIIIINAVMSGGGSGGAAEVVERRAAVAATEHVWDTSLLAKALACGLEPSCACQIAWFKDKS